VRVDLLFTDKPLPLWDGRVAPHLRWPRAPTDGTQIQSCIHSI
jgi:hypothetical protein